MPNRINKICLNNCAEHAIAGRHYCESCCAKIDAEREAKRQKYEKERQKIHGTAAARGYDYKWNKVASFVRRTEPICRMCKNKLAEMVDHVVPLKQGGERLALDNLQPLCNKCHVAKTAADVVKYSCADDGMIKNRLGGLKMAIEKPEKEKKSVKPPY